MNVTERDEAMEWLGRFEKQHEALLFDLSEHEERLSFYSVAAIKNEITRIGHYIEDIKQFVNPGGVLEDSQP